MRLWRIARRPYALDRACDGSRAHGGRWNPIGLPALYAGTTIEIAVLEKFVHLGGIAPPDFVLVSVDVPDDAAVTRIGVADLPAGWDDPIDPVVAQNIGAQWIRNHTALTLIVPSVIVAEANNAVINIIRPRFAEVQFRIVRDFHFDPRML